MSQIDEIKKDIDTLSQTVQLGQSHAKELVQHTEGIGARVERLAKNSVAAAAVIRNAFRRVWDLVKACLETGNQFVALAEKIGQEIAQAMSGDLIEQVSALVGCLEQCFGSIPLFVSMVQQLQDVRSNLETMFGAAHSFMDQVEAATQGSIETLRQDAALVQRDVQSVLAECLFKYHQGNASLLGCFKVARAMEPRSAGLAGLHRECLSALEAFEGSAGVDEFDDLKSSLQGMKENLEGMHDSFEDKLQALEKPPDGVSGWLASPFVKTYEAVDLGVDVTEDVCSIPDLWDEAKGMASKGRDLLQATHDRLEHFWESLAAMVRQLCDDLWVTYNEQFEDPSIPDVHFDPAQGFLGWFEHKCLAYLNKQTCFDGPRRLARQAMDAAKRQKDRSVKKRVVVVPPRDDAAEAEGKEQREEADEADPSGREGGSDDKFFAQGGYEEQREGACDADSLGREEGSDDEFFAQGEHEEQREKAYEADSLGREDGSDDEFFAQGEHEEQREGAYDADSLGREEGSDEEFFAQGDFRDDDDDEDFVRDDDEDFVEPA